MQQIFGLRLHNAIGASLPFAVAIPAIYKETRKEVKDDKAKKNLTPVGIAALPLAVASRANKQREQKETEGTKRI